MAVKIFARTEDGVFEGMTTESIVLRKGKTFVTCAGVVTFEYEDLTETFYDWLQMAELGIEGYTTHTA